MLDLELRPMAQAAIPTDRTFIEGAGIPVEEDCDRAVGETTRLSTRRWRR